MSACLLAVHLQMQFLHVCLVCPCCVCALLYVQLRGCLCMYVCATTRTSLVGTVRNAKAKMNRSCKQKHHNYTAVKSQSSQQFTGEGTFSTTLLSSIQKAFNSTAHPTCVAMRIEYLKYIPHACKQKLISLISHTLLKTLSRQRCRLSGCTPTSLIMVHY